MASDPQRRPTDPSWIDGYRAGIDACKDLVAVWYGCAVLEARKQHDEHRKDVAQESATALNRLRLAFDVLAQRPQRVVDFDDDTTQRDRPGKA